MSTQGLISQVKTRLSIETDYALAKALDIPTQRIADYQNGKAAPNNYAIAKFAKVLEVDPWTLVKEIEAQTEKNPGRREFWRKAAVIILGAVILNMSPSPAEATPNGAKSLITLYIMLNARRWVKRMAKRFADFVSSFPTTAALPACSAS